MVRRQISTLFLAVSALIACILHAPAAAQFAFPNLTVQVLRDPSPGYYLLAPSAIDSIAFLDNAGRYMYRTRVGPHSNALTYGDTWLTHYFSNQADKGFLRRGVNLKVIDTLRVTSPYVADFHEARIISDTSYIILGTYTVEMDLSEIFPWGDTAATVLANVIQERTFDGRTLFTWKSLDHIPVSDCADTSDLKGAFLDYIHINSVTKDRDGNYLVSARHLDEVFKIDRGTGAVMWRLGGSRSRSNQFRFLNDTTDGFFGFSHQHTASRTADGTLLLFDNGNLKPEPQYSRVVEYEIDEVNKTARRVWQFIPKPNVYVRSMGSAEEVENGNILIGYGSSSNYLYAQEVDREGVVHAQFANLGPNAMPAYRVHKTSFLMTGVYKRITSVGAVSLTKGDSSTHVSLNVTRLDAPTTVVAERHGYAPHNLVVAGSTPCSILPNRWVVRIKNIERVAGTMVFFVGNVPGVDYPDQVRLYHRSKEGTGSFTLVDAAYDAVRETMTVNEIRNGEFFLGSPNCLAPTIVEPVIGATEVPVAPLLRWGEAVGAQSYEVEMSTDPSFTVVARRFTTSRLDTTVSAFPEFSLVYWRVRTRSGNNAGPWSAIGRFTTVLGIPTLTWPVVVGSDTVAVLPGSAFTWSTASGAVQYRVTITPTGAPRPTVDTVLVSRSFVPTGLVPSTLYSWTVRSVNDTITGRASTPGVFASAPPAPSLLEPVSDAAEIAVTDVTFRWRSVKGAVTYDLDIRRASDSSVIVQRSVSDTAAIVEDLPGGERCMWTVRGRSTYGPGPWAPRRSFTTVSSVRLPAPRTSSPKLNGNVDTVSVTFLWGSVPGASSYDLQIASMTTFDAPDIERAGLTDTSITLPSLRSGTPYSWRVIASAPGTPGQWSDTACFTTTTPQGVALVPVLPLNGSATEWPGGTLVYTTSPAYISYEIFVDDDPAFGSPAFRTESPVGSSSYSGLVPGVLYYWKVVGIAPGEQRVEGPPARFRVRSVTSVDGNDTKNTLPPVIARTRDGLLITPGTNADGPLTISFYTVQGRLVGRSTIEATAGPASTPLPEGGGLIIVVVSSVDGVVASMTIVP